MDNTSLFFLIFNLSRHSDFADNLMIFGAEFVIFLAFIFQLIFAFKGRVPERKALLLTFISIPFVVILIKFIHVFIFTPRPFVDNEILPLVNYYSDASFPSRHASIMSAVAFSYVFTKSKWAILFILLMIWVGISRIFVGVHYPLDILGGILVGIISVAIARQFAGILKSKFLLTK